jgi:8-amino-7-oxononanoate synthase
MDLLQKCREYQPSRDFAVDGVYPYFLRLQESEGRTARYRGREVIMCGSNNYLGLTAHAEVRAASIEAINRYGTSCTGSRFLNGNLSLHEELEHRLATFFDTEAALVFSTGYQANLGAVNALVSRDDVIILDREVHASIVDAYRLTGAKLRRFRHNDINDLDRQLATCPLNTGKLVAVDGVYSMEGDICPLPEIVELCHRYGARLLLDDAHGTGVMASGRGTAAHFGATAQVDVTTITFSKSLASIGGAVLGNKNVVQYIRHKARSLIFSASIAPAGAAAALAALDILRREPWRAAQAMNNAATVRQQLVVLGYDVGTSITPIVPVHIPNKHEMVRLWQYLLDQGIYTNPIMPPAASSRLRSSYMATHTTEDLDRVVMAFRAAADLRQV